MSRELLRRLREATPDGNQNVDMYNLLLEVDRELAKPEPQPVGDALDLVSKAMRRAWGLGQTYWQQADSDSYKQQDKASLTQAKFEALVDSTRIELSALIARDAV